MQQLNIFYQLIMFMTFFSKCSNVVENALKEIINSDKICNSIERDKYEKNLAFDNVRILGEVVWNTITSNTVFKNITQNDTSENSFANRSSIMKLGYLDLMNTETHTTNFFEIFSEGEQNFLNEIITNTYNLFITLHHCFQGTVHNETSALEIIEKIITENTCFIANGINENLPSVVYKLCDGFIPNYQECFGENGMEYLSNYLKYNENELLKYKCIIDDRNTREFIEYTNKITEDIIIVMVSIYLILAFIFLIGFFWSRWRVTRTTERTLLKDPMI
ncbi:putative SP-containing membrane protein [Vairimorpha necatrix]|uniref:SP-containing membrane protein n=1 Tax=Vairimorpha necatrix TaxID=6039 RepID=A0AAX4JCB7_9MICR